MRMLAMACVLLLALACMPHAALADGCMIFPDFGKHVNAPSQKAAIFWDGSKEVMVLSTKITADEPQDIAWVVPIQSSTRPEVSEGNVDIFYGISWLLMPPSRGKGFSIIPEGQTAGIDAVEVLEEKSIDIYDIAILRATDAGVLVDWLNENGFSTPQEAMPVLQHYAGRPDFYFIANRIDLENKYAGIEITEYDRSCADELVGRSPYDRYTDQTINWTIENPQYMTRNLKESGCGNASAAAVSMLYGLKAGLSTPLKIVFRPPEPFYPMRMTSINRGEVTASVYVFSDSFVRDSSGLMSVEAMTSAGDDNSWFNGIINETSEEFSRPVNHLTYLTFSGDTALLTGDSVFIDAAYEPSKDPNYVNPMTTMMQSFSGVVALALFPFYMLASMLPALV